MSVKALQAKLMTTTERASVGNNEPPEISTTNLLRKRCVVVRLPGHAAKVQPFAVPQIERRPLRRATREPLYLEPVRTDIAHGTRSFPARATLRR